MVDDIRIRRVGHPTVKGLEVTKPTGRCCQSGFGRLVHQALNRVQETVLLVRGQVAPFLADSHLLASAVPAEKSGNIIRCGLGVVSFHR